MELEKAKVELSSEGVLYPLSEAELSNKLNTGWSVFEGRIDSTVIPSVGDNATIYWGRGDTLEEFWTGQIVNVKKNESGKKWYYKITAHGPGRKLKWRIVKPPSGRMTEEEYIDQVMSPLAGELDWVTSGLTGTIVPSKYEKNKNYVLDVLENFCSGRTINFYTRRGTVHFFKGAEGTYSTVLSNFTVKERVEDITKIFNSIDLYNYNQKVFESDDYWTEDSSDLDFWSVINSSEMGTKEVLTCSEDESRHAILVRSTLDTQTRVYIQCSLGTELTSDTLTSFVGKYTAIEDQMGYFQPNKFRLRLYLMSNSLTPGDSPTNCLVANLGNVEWEIRTSAFMDYYSKACLKDINIQIDEFETIGTFNGTISYVLFELEGLRQTHKMNYEDGVIWVTSISNKPGLIIDSMYFGCIGRCSYANTASVEQYGLRVYLPEDQLYEGSYSDGIAKAKSIIDPLAFPEKSIRKLELEGTFPIYLGSQYTIDGTGYLVEEVKHTWNGEEWKTELILSSSPVKAPSRERVVKIKDLVSKVRSLRREVNILDSGVVDAFDQITSLLSGRTGFMKLNYLDGTLYSDNLLVKAENIDDLTIEKSKILRMDVNTIGTIEQIDEIKNMNVDHIGEINNIDRINYANIGTISTIENVGVMSVDTIATIEEISNIGVMSVDKISSIGTISTIDFFYAKNSSIDSIGYVGDLTAVNANISTISNVDKAFITDSSIETLSHVDTAYILDATLVTGTISTLSAYTAGFDLAYFAYCTIADMDITAGNIENVILNKCTISGVTIDAATISNLNVIGEIQGDNIITADNIQNLAISFEHLQKGIQNVIGSTLWEAEDLSYGNGGYLVSDSSASGGTLVRSTVSSTGPFVWGPNQTLNPGDYFVHFRLRREPLGGITPVAYIEVYDSSASSILSSKTLSGWDLYHLQNGEFDWCSAILLAPGVKAGHSIQIRVRNLKDKTLDVDYIKVEPSGRFLDSSVLAPSFKIETENIEDFAIVGSKIGSLEIDTHHIKNFAIDNSKIQTFTITYDRLKKSPIGWNEVLNPSFEYGTWGSSEDHTVSPGYHGNVCNSLSTTWGKKVGGTCNLISIDVFPSGSIVVSGYFKGTVTSGYFYHRLIFFDSNRDSIDCWNWATIGSFGYSNWTRLSNTYDISDFPTNTKYIAISPRFWSDNGCAGTVLMDAFMIEDGDQLTSFVDTTVAKNRWWPDLLISKEADTIETANASWPGETIIAVTFPVDYKCKALIWTSFNYRIFGPTQRGYVCIQKDGENIYPTPWATGWRISEDALGHWSRNEICTLEPGIHTISVNVFVVSGDTIYVEQRILSVLCGQYIPD